MPTTLTLTDGTVRTLTEARKDARSEAEVIKSLDVQGTKALAQAAVAFAKVKASGLYLAMLTAKDLQDLKADGRQTGWAKFYDLCGFHKVKAHRVLRKGETIIALENAGMPIQVAMGFSADTLDALRTVASNAGEGKSSDWKAPLDVVASLTADGKPVTAQNVRQSVETDDDADGNNSPTDKVVSLQGPILAIAGAIRNGTPIVLGNINVQDIDLVIAFLQERRPVILEAELEAAELEAENDAEDEVETN